MKLKFTLILAVIVVVAIGGVACRQLSPASARKPIYYTCPMHPSVKVAGPGDCPICGMKLVPAYSETSNGSSAPCGATCVGSPEPTAKPR